MTLQKELNEIVQQAIKKILTLSDEGEIDAVVVAAIAKLDRVLTSGQEERDLRKAAKKTLITAQLKIHTTEREDVVKTLIDLSGDLKAASQLMDESAADNILNKVATTGNAVLAVANSAKDLADTLKDAVETPGSVESETLSEKVNDTLDKINSLKNL